MSSRRPAARARGKKAPSIPQEVTPKRSKIQDGLSPPPLLPRNVILTSNMSGSRNKRPLEQEGTPVRKGYMRRQPTVKLFSTKLKLENAEEKQSVKESDDGQHSDTESTDNNSTAPLSMSHAHNVLTPSNKHFRKVGYGKTHQQKDSYENKACATLEAICIWKQPIVKLLRLNLEPEQEEKHATDESDVSDDDQPSTREQSGLSAYELERLNNIKENSTFLNSLKLLETASSLHPAKQTRKRTPQKRRYKVTRRSLRLQCVKRVQRPKPLPFKVRNNPVKPINRKKPPGPIEMVATNDKDCGAVQTFLRTWASISQDPVESPRTYCKELLWYKADLQALKLRDKSVAKVVPSGVRSVAVHPSKSRILVAAGDKWGYVGLWDVKDQSPGNGVYTFVPHCKAVSTLLFSPSNPAHLLSLSYDGTVRCSDVNSFLFDEIYRDEEECFSSFDFLSADGSVLIVSHWDSQLSVIDRRTPGTTHEMRISVGMPSAQTVHVHPLRRELCVVAGSSDVYLYDVRKLYERKSKPVLTVPGHTKSVSSAFFSPGTGHRILTTCTDGFLRVYNSESLGSSVNLLTQIRHNTIHDWRAYFRAVWDPKQENCFMVGTLARPRQIMVFHEKGERVYTLWNPETLMSVCAINAIHPTRNLVVGGNTTGKLHVFY